MLRPPRGGGAVGLPGGRSGTDDDRPVCHDHIVGGSVTFTLWAKDVDSCADPRPMTDEIDFTGWPGNAPQKVMEQDGLFHYEATHVKTYDTPGKYHVAIYADDRGLYKLDPNNCTPSGGGNSHDQCYECDIVVLKVTMAYPADGQKVVGYNEPGGVRETRQFKLDFIATVDPIDIVGSASVTFVYSKGAASGTAAGTLEAGTNRFSYLGWDIRQRFTKTSERYGIKARVTYDGVTCESGENVICIKKGQQSVTLAGDWLHYPYHWGARDRTPAAVSPATGCLPMAATATAHMIMTTILPRAVTQHAMTAPDLRGSC
ncbi:MAG: hypothetical protein K6U00_00790 [Armatimonadetes bacterium]|nr:hypothetical protein [Armatimonadota bacterium]